MLQVDDATSLPWLYHLNSEPWLNLEAYNDPTNEVQFKELSEESASLKLPKLTRESGIRRLIKQRHSCRQFERRAMPLDQLAELLAHAYGIVEIFQTAQGAWTCTRPVPSAGGLYPLEFYAALGNVDDAADGLYHYNALHHCLEPMMSGPVLEGLGSFLLEQQFLKDTNAVIFISAVFNRTLKKYGPRGYRYMLMEAGHCAQNLSLSAVELGLGLVCLGGFHDSKLNKLLHLDGKNEAVLYCAAVGYPAAESAKAPDALSLPG